MIVKCIYNLGKNIPLTNRCNGEDDGTDFSYIKKEHEYVVYGLEFYPNTMHCLICAEEGNPYWTPIDLFEIIDHRLPSDWLICVPRFHEPFNFLYKNCDIQTLIGYSELVTSVSHYEGIIEREEDDLIKYFYEKEKIDKWQLGDKTITF